MSEAKNLCASLADERHHAIPAEGFSSHHNDRRSMNAPLKPSVSPARAAAFDILLRVEQHGSYGSELLHAQEAARLSAADHGLATELVMGVLRWRGLLDRTIDEFSSQKSDRLDLEVLKIGRASCRERVRI